MLKKKAGLIVAGGAVAAMAAVSPMAFADQDSGGAGNGGNGNNINSPIEACNNDVQGQVGLVPVQDVGENPTAGPVNGAAGLLGKGASQQDSQHQNTRACGQGASGAGQDNSGGQGAGNAAVQGDDQGSGEDGGQGGN